MFSLFSQIPVVLNYFYCFVYNFTSIWAQIFHKIVVKFEKKKTYIFSENVQKIWPEVSQIVIFELYTKLGSRWNTIPSVSTVSFEDMILWNFLTLRNFQKNFKKISKNLTRGFPNCNFWIIHKIRFKMEYYSICFVK